MRQFRDMIRSAKKINKAEELGAKPQFNIINYEILREMLKDYKKETSITQKQKDELITRWMFQTR